MVGDNGAPGSGDAPGPWGKAPRAGAAPRPKTMLFLCSICFRCPMAAPLGIVALQGVLHQPCVFCHSSVIKKSYFQSVEAGAAWAGSWLCHVSGPGTSAGDNVPPALQPSWFPESLLNSTSSFFNSAEAGRTIGGA